ncbi:MAG: hypothetical protein ABSH20_25925 [Tepidisphaeraceae bacterium]|jgi:hypothetical protein
MDDQQIHPHNDAGPPRPRSDGRWRKRVSIAYVVAIGAVIALFVTGVVLVFVVIGKTFDNMEKARKHIQVVQSALANDARFSRVVFCYDFTVSNGPLLVTGSVDSGTDLAALNEQIRATSPPVSVSYQVRISPRGRTQPQSATQPARE